MSSLRLKVSGMSCASCVGRVEKALRKQPGVLSADVNLATETASVALQDGAETAPLLAALAKAGYPATLDEPAQPVRAPWAQTGWPVLIGVLLSLPLVAPMLLGHGAMLPGRAVRTGRRHRDAGRRQRAGGPGVPLPPRVPGAPAARRLGRRRLRARGPGAFHRPLHRLRPARAGLTRRRHHACGRGHLAPGGTESPHPARRGGGDVDGRTDRNRRARRLPAAWLLLPVVAGAAVDDGGVRPRHRAGLLLAAAGHRELRAPASTGQPRQPGDAVRRLHLRLRPHARAGRVDDLAPRLRAADGGQVHHRLRVGADGHRRLAAQPQAADPAVRRRDARRQRGAAPRDGPPPQRGGPPARNRAGPGRHAVGHRRRLHHDRRREPRHAHQCGGRAHHRLAGRRRAGPPGLGSVCVRRHDDGPGRAQPHHGGARRAAAVPDGLRRPRRRRAARR
ncbi:heavy metal-associated domain protein, partial [Ostertagia ostertagi]